MGNDLSTRFIHAYNELDAYMDRKLNNDRYISHTELLKRMGRYNKVIANNMDELKAYARLRNAIVHESNNHVNPIAEPHVKVVEHYERIVQSVIQPKRALDMATKRAQMHVAHLDMKIIDAVRLMTKHQISHLPILDGQQLVGVFSENSIFTFMSKNPGRVFSEDWPIRSLKGSYERNHHLSERFEFVSKECIDLDIIALFARDLDQGKRLAAVFVTSTGEPNEPIQGMISSWDVFEYMDTFKLSRL